MIDDLGHARINTAARPGYHPRPRPVYERVGEPVSPFAMWIDHRTGTASAMTAGAHAPAFLGLVILWALARHERHGPSGENQGLRQGDPSPAGDRSAHDQAASA
jgi:hypothetical protein